jgi:hypothetical protein
MTWSAWLLVPTLVMAGALGLLSSIQAQEFESSFMRIDGGHVTTNLVRASARVIAPSVVDPDLAPGFPVQTYESAGSYHAGPALHTLVGNIDADAHPEILITALAGGALYAWHWDGSAVAGWPASGAGASYPALGHLSTAFPGLQVFAAHWSQPGLAAYAGTGVALAGWPRNSANYNATPAGLGDVNGDGLDEIFTEEEDWHLHGYTAKGAVLPNWPTAEFLGGQERHTPAIADLDGDGVPEIISASGSTSPGVYLFVNHADRSTVSGFPVLTTGYVDTFPVVGDVDGDGQPEIVMVTASGVVRIFAANGALKRTMQASGDVFYGTAPALADLNHDGIPEIIVQTNSALNVWKGDGSVYPGWPQNFGPNYWMGNSAPVVGDVDGDGQPDIAITLQQAGSSVNGEVRLYSRSGLLHPHFPKALSIGAGAVPAIADLYGDGRNELIVGGTAWGGYNGLYDKVWVYDLHGTGPYGRIEWGQFNGGAEHNGHYSAFVDDPLIAGRTVIQAVHITELRARINALRVRYALPNYVWTDPSLTPGVTVASAAHVLELRTALTQAYVAGGVVAPVFTDPDSLVGIPVKRIHISDLRAAVLALEQH